MNDDSWNIMVVVVVVGLIVLGGYAMHQHTERTKAFIAAGYQRQAVPGVNGAEWVNGRDE